MLRYNNKRKHPLSINVAVLFSTLIHFFKLVYLIVQYFEIN